MIHRLACTSPLLLAFCGAAFAAPSFEVVSADFGVFEETKGSEIVFQPTQIVPLAVGQRYGWMIELRTQKRSLSVREEYVLPQRKAAEPDSQAGRNLHVPDLRRSQVSQRQLVPVDGQIVGEWSVGPGEPPGKRKLQVMIEGELSATFEFEMK